MQKVTPKTSLLTSILQSEAFTNFMDNYNIAITVVLGIVTILVITLLFLNITKLSASTDNDYKRREAISGILTCLVCLAVIGGIDTVYAILLSFVMSMA